VIMHDFMAIDNLLSEDERALRSLVADFVKREVVPVIAAHVRSATFPMALIAKLGELGVLGPTLPEAYGGLGLNNVAYGLIMQELERGDSAIRSFASVQGALVMYPIFTFGTQAQKEHWLPRLASGSAVGCFGLTEPDHGSDPAGMQTRLERHGDRLLLNGAKMWITNGSIADVAVVWAKLDGEVVGVLVEKEMEGFSAPEMKGKFSLRASVTSELVFQDVEIPPENLLPQGKGLAAPLRCLNQARYGIAWGAMGAAMACYDEALDYAKTRIQFAKPIAAFQLVQNKLVEMVTEISKGQLLALQLGRLKDKGELRHPQVSLAKRNNVWQALRIARMARDILGANGISDEYAAMRHASNLESVYTYEGTHDIHALIVGRDITGISALQ
jgi:glutaryl-CoA dehydrogenase